MNDDRPTSIVSGDLSKITRFFRTNQLPNALLQQEWDRIHARNDLKRQVANYVATVDSFRRIPRSSGGARGIAIFVGPQGTGKSTLARGAANLYAQLGLKKDGKKTTLLEARASQWTNGLLGETQKPSSFTHAGS